MIRSDNEWGRLRRVVVGTATGARVPRDGVDLRAINYAGASAAVHGPYPDRVIEEANEDLEGLCDVLRAFGAVVLRPDPGHLDRTVSNGLWESDGYYAYCPRDSFLVVGDRIIETPMPLRARYHENFAYRSIFLDAFEDGARWLSAPKPLLADAHYRTSGITKDVLTLNEAEPCFDAANVLRAGRDILYLVSNSGNRLGGRWLQSILGTEYKVHFLEGIYSYMHLDSTISLLREGLALLNPARITQEMIPPALAGWDCVFSEPNTDIGYHPPYNHASVWVGMNLLMLDPQTAVVEASQSALIRQLEGIGITVMPVRMRHARTLGGCIHCVTNDLHRE